METRAILDCGHKVTGKATDLLCSGTAYCEDCKELRRVSIVYVRTTVNNQAVSLPIGRG